MINPLKNRNGEYDKLVKMSRSKHYYAFTEIDWPESLPDDQYWMSPELLTVANTRYAEDLSTEQLMKLSHYESINLYSILVFGERVLNKVVMSHLHKDGYSEESEYFYHFIEEENQHMWFFSQFCIRYGGKLYPNRALSFREHGNGRIESFLSFAKITIFEEIGDYLNVAMKADRRLPPIVRKINHLHHLDESRHLAMGRKLLEKKYKEMSLTEKKAELEEIEDYLKRFIITTLEGFYNPAVYRDAGFKNAYELRAHLLADENRKQMHNRILVRLVSFMYKIGVFKKEGFWYECTK